MEPCSNTPAIWLYANRRGVFVYYRFNISILILSTNKNVRLYNYIKSLKILNLLYIRLYKENVLKIMDILQLSTLDKSEQKILSNYANGILLSIVSENRVKNFIENIKDKESDESMFLLPERVKTWYNEDIAKAKNRKIFE